MVLFEGTTPVTRWGDLALAKLDSPVRWIPSAELPTTPGQCNGPVAGLMNGTHVGYSDHNLRSAEIDLPANEFICPPPSTGDGVPVRRMGNSSWLRVDATSEGGPPDRSYWKSDLVVPRNQNACTAFAGGQLDGDSGGPLFSGCPDALCSPSNKSFLLCGIHKGKNDDVFDEEVRVEFHRPALDSPDVIAWINSVIVDPNTGRTAYECPAVTGPSDDLDGDLVHDECDTCPRIHNPEQLTGAGAPDDWDADGFGAACDLCPEALDDGENSNHEAELEWFLAEAKSQWNVDVPLDGGRYPILRLTPGCTGAGCEFLTLSDLQAATALYRFVFRPNRCEEVAEPSIDRKHVSSVMDLPGIASPPVPIPAACGPLNDCSWEPDNRVALKARASDFAEMAKTALTYHEADVGLRWAPCPDSISSNRDTPAGRLKCLQRPGSEPRTNAFKNILVGTQWESVETYGTNGIAAYGTDIRRVNAPASASDV